MVELKWPVDNCEHCGTELTGIPQPKDKALSEDGSRKPMWADFCPKCGRGYVVGERVIPVPKEMAQEKPIIKLPSPDQPAEQPEPDIPTESEGESQSIDKSKMEIEKPPEEVTPTPAENAPEPHLACPTCGKVCKSAFGLMSHMRSHKKEV